MKDRLSTTLVLAYPNFDLPFILTTDAPKTAVAAILSQVQDGIERPIGYAIRQLNAAESVYSAWCGRRDISLLPVGQTLIVQN